MNRRSILAGTPLAAVAGVLPAATLGQAGQDQELVAVCDEIAALQSHIDASYPNGCTLEEERHYDQAMLPFLERQDELVSRFCDLNAFTLAGHISRARAILAKFPDCIHSPRDGFYEMVAKLVNDLTAGGLA